jgi:hypothetical protein
MLKALILLFYHKVLYPHLDLLSNALAMSNAEAMIYPILINQHKRF